MHLDFIFLQNTFPCDAFYFLDHYLFSSIYYFLLLHKLYWAQAISVDIVLYIYPGTVVMNHVIWLLSVCLSVSCEIISNYNSDEHLVKLDVC